MDVLSFSLFLYENLMGKFCMTFKNKILEPLWKSKLLGYSSRILLIKLYKCSKYTFVRQDLPLQSVAVITDSNPDWSYLLSSGIIKNNIVFKTGESLDFVSFLSLESLFLCVGIFPNYSKHELSSNEFIFNKWVPIGFLVPFLLTLAGELLFSA